VNEAKIYIFGENRIRVVWKISELKLAIKMINLAIYA
jgi:hypothetical protein